ncbi:MAG: TIGR03089 family protein [Candidatus Nanopelagicales bacterium]|nr:TIGR03089 family protein [Candidatus Nanopelagicales bacterium]
MQTPETKDIWQLLTGFPDPQQPFITTNFADGGRIELSLTTFTNGAAKAANALRDLLDVEPGALVRVDLGWSWQQSIWQAATLISGAQLVSANADIAIVAAAQVSEASAGFDGEVYGVSTDVWGRPQGCEGEITAEVLGQPDSWMYPEYFASHGALVEQALQWGEDHGVTAKDRIGIDSGHILPNLLIPFVLPLVFSGSVVLTDHLDENLIAQEQITCKLLRSS